MPKRRYKYSDKSERQIRKLTPIFLVVKYVKCCVLEFPFSGYFKKLESGALEPLVYDFDDHNGTHPEWVLRLINDTTTGSCITWTFYKETAKRIAKACNEDKIWH